jgi:hypothetical protein
MEYLTARRALIASIASIARREPAILVPAYFVPFRSFLYKLTIQLVLWEPMPSTRGARYLIVIRSSPTENLKCKRTVFAHVSERIDAVMHTRGLEFKSTGVANFL